MKKFYAVCNVNGPISTLIIAEDEDAAISEFASMDHRGIIDHAETDAEDYLGIDGANMDEDEFEEALKSAGCEPIRSLEPIINAHAGTSYHLAGGWYLWAAPQKK